MSLIANPTSRPCFCWQQVNLHEGHCCFAEILEDWATGTPIPCGHEAGA